MNNAPILPFAPQISPWKLLLLTLAASLLGFQLVGVFVGMVVAYPFYDGTVSSFILDISNPLANPAVKIPLMIVQGVGSAFGLIFIPWLVYAKGFGVPLHFGQQKFSPALGLLVVFIMLSFIVINTPVGEWNQHITLPQSMAGIEHALKSMEENLKVITEFLIKFDSPAEFLLGLVVVAVIPAIGEELVFRGLVQNHLMRLTRNTHLAVWIAAFIFGAIHFQFYGLVPRMLLGGLFGYLYVFSGKLSYAMWAHFLNNGIAVTATYLHQLGYISYDIDQPTEVTLPQFLTSVLVFAALLLVFKQQVNRTSING